MSYISYREPTPDAVPAPARAWGMLFLGLLTWFIPAIVFAAVVAGLSGLVLVPWIAPIAAPVLAFFVAATINRFFRQRARRRASIILTYIENAVRLNLPIDRFLAAAERSESGILRFQIRIIRQQLQRGSALSTALNTSIFEFPDSIAAEIAVAEQLGRLRPALSRIIENELQSHPTGDDDEADKSYRLYPIALFLTVLISMMTINIFILPKFREIFKDFNTQLPPLTEGYLAVGAFLQDTFIAPALIFFGFIALILAIAFQLHRIFTNWPVPSFQNTFQWIAWYIPLWHGIERDRSLAAASAALADATRHGIPLHTALTFTNTLPLNIHIKQRLMNWQTHLLTGNAPAHGAANARLPKAFVSFLSTTSSRSSEALALPDIFDFLARYYRDRFSRLYMLLCAAIQPVTVILLGLFVGSFIASIIVAMNKLLQNMMPGGYII